MREEGPTQVKDEINSGRQKNIDYAKVIAIVFIRKPAKDPWL